MKYKDSYFEHLVLTTIRGEPTYKTLHHIKNELKANASSAPTTLVGGNCGYLGMVLTPAEYRRILPNNPFTRPPNLGVLSPNPNGTAAQIASAENNHRLTKNFIYILFFDQLQGLLLRSPSPNNDPQGTYIQDTTPSQERTKRKLKFSPNHLGRRQSWLSMHGTHTRRVPPHLDYQHLHQAT